MRAVIETTAMARIDYVSVAHPDTLEELDQVTDHALLSLTAFVGGVRLIDNLFVSMKEAETPHEPQQGCSSGSIPREESV
jgi:pantoate--beta-alanine ligase